MRTERFATPEPDAAKIGPGTLILAAVGCFAIGFAVLMIVPKFWPRYIQTPVATRPEPSRPIEAVVEAPRQPAPTPPAPGIVTEIRMASAKPAPQKIASYGTLAGLAECKAVIRAGGIYEKVGSEQMAAMLGARGKALTSSQIDTGCRKLTE